MEKREERSNRQHRDGGRNKQRKRWRQPQQNEEKERVCFVHLCTCINLSVVSFVGSQKHDQGLTLLWWQLLATIEKTDQFGFSLQHSPAMLPMTPQNIQLLGSTEGAGEHRKKQIVASQNEDSSPMNELIFCPPALSHLHWHNAAL